MNNLLPEIQSEIIFRIDNEASRSNLALTCSMFGSGPFQDNRILAKLSQYIDDGKFDVALKLLTIRPDFKDQLTSLLKTALFKLAGFGEQDKMEIILKLHPEFLLEYGVIKDISNVCPVIDNKESKGITVFQHALWAGDISYMCNMMVDCLPKDEHGERIKIELLRQYRELKTEGVVYTLYDKEHREKQFSLQPFINSQEEYENFGAQWSRTEVDSFWCTRVAPLLALFPAIVRHHFCYNSFSPSIDSFCNPELNSEFTRSLEIFVFDGCGGKQLWDNYLTLDDLGHYRPTLTVQGHDYHWAFLPGGSMLETWPKTVNILIERVTALSEAGEQIHLPMLLEKLNNPVENLNQAMQHA